MLRECRVEKLRIERGKNTEGGEWLLCDVNIIKLRMFICLHVNNDKKTMASLLRSDAIPYLSSSLPFIPFHFAVFARNGVTKQFGVA